MLENYEFYNHDDNFLHGLGERKREGWLVLNGHVQSEWDFIWFVRHLLHHPYHFYDEVSFSKKVLNVTAGFNAGSELDYGHIKSYFHKNGIDWEENLGLWNAVNNFSHTHDGFHVKNFMEFQKWMHRRHLDKTADIQYELHRYLAEIRERFSNMQMYELFISAHQEPWEGQLAHLEDNRLKNIGLVHDGYLKSLFDALKENDREFFGTWEHCTNKFFEDSGIWQSGTYHDYRNSLGDQILSSASVFFWGGQWNVMQDCLSFFQLKPFMQEAYRRGTNFYGMSAGVIVLSDEIYMIGERTSPNGYQYPYGKGLGLLDKTYAYSHIYDSGFIRSEDYDTISSTALRHSPCPTIGLTRNSTALIENGNNILEAYRL